MENESHDVSVSNWCRSLLSIQVGLWFEAGSCHSGGCTKRLGLRQRLDAKWRQAGKLEQGGASGALHLPSSQTMVAHRAQTGIVRHTHTHTISEFVCISPAELWRHHNSAVDQVITVRSQDLLNNFLAVSHWWGMWRVYFSVVYPLVICFYQKITFHSHDGIVLKCLISTKWFEQVCAWVEVHVCAWVEVLYREWERRKIEDDKWILWYFDVWSSYYVSVSTLE